MPARTEDNPAISVAPPPLDHDVRGWLRYWASEQPSALAWADDHRRCDYATAEERVLALTQHLGRLGVGQGDRIAVWLGNRGATLEALFAAAQLGAVMLPINARLTAAEVAFQLGDSEPRVMLVERAWRAEADAACALASSNPPHRLEVGTTEGAPEPDAYEEALSNARPIPPATSTTAPIAPPEEVDPEAPLILMYTSGTTGKPKGALLPKRKAFYNSLNARAFFNIRSSDRILVVAPLFHSLGLQILAIPALFAGAGLVIQEGFDARRVWETIEAESITYYGGVPTLHHRLLDALTEGDPFSEVPDSLRFAFTAGAAAAVELIRAFDRRGILLKQGYGQTETSILTCLDADQALAKAGSVGRPVGHAELRLIEPSSLDGPISEWRDAEIGEVGEVVVKGPITMLGYWRRPKATAETLREGWLRTGDLATRDADFDVTLVGRAREMYISGGENVYPAEIEATLVEHPLIEEAAVLAIPDSQWGEVGRAHIVLTGAGKKGFDLDEVGPWLASRLARFKQPKFFIIEDVLPRTASGKVQKHRLRAD